MVRKAWDLCPQDKRTELFKLLYDTPLSNQTFIHGVEQLIGTEFRPYEDI